MKITPESTITVANYSGKQMKMICVKLPWTSRSGLIIVRKKKSVFLVTITGKTLHRNSENPESLSLPIKFQTCRAQTAYNAINGSRPTRFIGEKQGSHGRASKTS